MENITIKQYIPNESSAFCNSKVTKEVFAKCLMANKLMPEYAKCCICNWDKASVDWAHIVSARDGGDYSLKNIAPLCPKHHRLFDNGAFKKREKRLMQEFIVSISDKLHG